MAAPVGHIICALAFLNSGTTVDLVGKNAFLAGTNFPDIRYIAKDLSRSMSHRFIGDDLSYVETATSSFEAGRRFHVFVDREREKHMRKFDAYRFVKNGPLKTQMLKIIEDNILFDRLKNQIDVHQIFGKIYDEERRFSVKTSEIDTWHKLLITYLEPSYWFNFYRYYKTLREFQNAQGLPEELFGNIWLSIRTLGFFVYAYFQVEKLSRDQELRAIILDFYENKIKDIIKTYRERNNVRAVELYLLGPPPKVHLSMKSKALS